MQTAQSGFGLLDAVVVAAYFVGTLWLGLKLGRKQKDAKDYFVGDHRPALVGHQFLGHRHGNECADVYLDSRARLRRQSGIPSGRVWIFWLDGSS